MVAAVYGGFRDARQARAVSINVKQGQPVCIARRARGARQNKNAVGAGPVGNKHLATGQLETITAFLGRHCCSSGGVFGPFVNSERIEKRSIRNAGQSVTGGTTQCSGGHDGGRDERRRGKGQPHVFGQNARGAVAHVGPARIFGHQNSGPTHLGHFFP